MAKFIDEEEMFLKPLAALRAEKGQPIPRPRPGVDVEECLSEELDASQARVAELEAAIRAHRDAGWQELPSASIWGKANAALYAVLPETQKETP